MDLVLGRAVAIEIVPVADAALRQRVARDIRGLARVRHRNVITVHDVVVGDNHVAVVTEPIDGDSMAAWLQRCRPSRRAILRVIEQVAEGLSAAHAGGVVHGAVRLGHILIDGNGRVIVAGFGLARAAGRAAPDPRGARWQRAHPGCRPVRAVRDAVGGAVRRAAVCRRDAEQVALAIRAGRPSTRRIPLGLRGPLRRGMAYAAALRWPSIDDLMRAVRGGLRPRRAGIAVAASAAIALAALAVVIVHRLTHVDQRARTYAQMERFANKMCMCSTATCARDVTQEMSKWATTATTDSDITARQPTTDERRIMQKLADCAGKAMMDN